MPTSEKKNTSTKQHLVSKTSNAWKVSQKFCTFFLGFGFCSKQVELNIQFNWIDFSVLEISILGRLEIPKFPNRPDFQTRQSRLEKKAPMVTSVGVFCWVTCELLSMPPRQTFPAFRTALGKKVIASPIYKGVLFTRGPFQYIKATNTEYRQKFAGLETNLVRHWPARKARLIPQGRNLTMAGLACPISSNPQRSSFFCRPGPSFSLQTAVRIPWTRECLSQRVTALWA